MQLKTLFNLESWKGWLLEKIRRTITPLEKVKAVKNFPSGLKFSLSPLWKGDLYFKLFGCPQSYIDEFEFLKGDGPYTGNIIDVGANIGSYALYFAAELLKRNGRKVFAFEPVQAINQKLQRNVAVNNYGNLIQVESFAVSNKTGMAPMFVDRNIEKDPGQSSLVNKTDQPQSVVTVPTITLDEYCLRNKIGQISLIKIDTEGNELEILEGGGKTLAEYRPKLLFELDLKNFHNNIAEAEEAFGKILFPLGYKLFFVQDKRMVPLKDAKFTCGNVWAFSK